MTSAVDERPDLATRYGGGRRRGAAGRPRFERWGIAVGAVLTLLVVAFWGANLLQQGASSSIQSTVVNFRVIDDGTVEADLRLAVQPGTAMVCAVEATNPQYLVVGWDVIDVPAIDDGTRMLTVELRTTQRADTVVVKSCWIP